MQAHTLGALITLAALGALLYSEVRSLPWLRWASKPIASTGFMVVALSAGWPRDSFGIAMTAALGLCLVGDVLLIPARREIFMAGIGAFLLGHLAYGAAFLARGVEIHWALVALVPLAVVAWLVRRWLGPHVPARMAIPVQAYIVVITAMVALASGTLGRRPDGEGLAIAVAAAAFFTSDLAVARHRFVKTHYTNRLWGLPLYYGAQLVLAGLVSKAWM